MTDSRHKHSAGVCNKCGRRFVTLVAASCPACGGSIVAAPKGAGKRVGWLSLPPLRYARAYRWMVVLASLDIVLTWLILVCFGGQEVNQVAASVILHRGLLGVTVFKFCLIVFVIVMCEVIGRRRDATARRLSQWGVAIGAIPICVGMAQLLDLARITMF